MSLVVLSHHRGLMWVAMNSTTVVSAPVLYFNHNAARWRRPEDLLIGLRWYCTTKPLLGSFLFLAYHRSRPGWNHVLFDQLIQDAPRLSAPAACRFSCCSSSLRTKMACGGPAEQHGRPDAYVEAPGMVAANLRVAVTNYLRLPAILRVLTRSAAPGLTANSPARSWSSWYCWRWPSPPFSWAG